MAGTFTSNQAVKCNNVTFPEFFRSRSLASIDARLFFSDCRYDVIIGRDVISQMGLIMDFKEDFLDWDGRTIVMRPFPDEPRQSSPNQVGDPPIADQMFVNMLEEELEDDAYLVSNPVEKLPSSKIFTSGSKCHSSRPQDAGYKTAKQEIKESKYESADLADVVGKCDHLNPTQQAELLAVLSKHENLFNGKLGKYNGPPVHLDLEENAVPHRTRAYDIPHSQKLIFKGELDRLVKIGVLEECGRSEWISGTFIIPKKDGRVRWISDFRALNKALKRKVWPMPLISELLAK
jgi:hypothetical protein